MSDVFCAEHSGNAAFKLEVSHRYGEFYWRPIRHNEQLATCAVTSAQEALTAVDWLRGCQEDPRGSFCATPQSTPQLVLRKYTLGTDIAFCVDEYTLALDRGAIEELMLFISTRAAHVLLRPAQPPPAFGL